MLGNEVLNNAVNEQVSSQTRSTAQSQTPQMTPQQEETLGRAFFSVLQKVQQAANENANNGG